MHFLEMADPTTGLKENNMFTSRKHYSLPAEERGSNDFLALQYLGRLQIAVSGTYTGNLYRFSPLQSVQQVHPRDAFHLLNSGLFGVAL
jgi:hypothetical protein